MTQRLEFVNPSGNLTLDESEIVAKNLNKVHTGVGDARVDVPQNDAIIPYVQRQDRINYYVDGVPEFTGYAVGFQGNELTGKWTLRLDGVGKRLEETRPDYDALGGPVVYTNTRLDDAIQDYWDRTPFSATVSQQVPETVATDELLQDADLTAEWDSVVSIAATDPLSTANDKLSVLQTGFFENENSFSSTDFGVSSAPDFESGEALSEESGFIEFEFTVEYTIPEEEVGLRARQRADGPAAEVDYQLNGDVLADNVSFGASSNASWSGQIADGLGGFGDGYTGGDLTPGTYTVRIDVTNTASDTYFLDCLHVYDRRYNYTFDDTLDANDLLSGPELYPDSLSVELNEQQTAYNIAEATVTTTWNDTSGTQAIGVSNDGGASYDTTNNSQTASVDFNSSGRNAQVKFTFSRWGTRTTQSPTTGFNGQEIDDYTLEVDLTNLVVIDRLELSRDHFANLKQLHDYGGFLWVIEHGSGDLDTLSVSSFARGQETRTSPPEFSDVENIKPEVAAENYFNSVYLEGALQSDGTRPTATVKSDSAIAEDRDEITPGVLRDQNISTESGAQFRANALLAAALENNALRGTIETNPVYVQPGFAYPVDFGEGEADKTLESVSITESAGSVQATYEFVTRQELSNTLDDLKREGRTIGNEV